MRALAFACLLLIAGCGDTESPGTSETTTSAGGGTGTATDGSGGIGTGGAATTTAAGGTVTAGGSGGAAASGGSGGAGGAGTGGGTSTSTTGTGGGMPGPCTWGDDCGSGWYCLAPGCGAGDCVQKPVRAGASPDPMPVCGCDGVTYWNEDIAASKGMSVAAMGECAAPPMPCGPGMACPPGTKCDRQVADEASCGPQIDGQCWATPLSCPLDGPMGRACSNNQCELECSLIQSQNPWFPDPTCN